MNQRIKPRIEIKKANNQCVDAENEAGSRVLLAQHPRPSRFSGHDWRWANKN
jgi:hypothetical protein